MVVSFFGKIENKNVDLSVWKEPIYRGEQLATKTMVVPVNDITELHLTFPIPDQACELLDCDLDFKVKIFVIYPLNFKLI